MALDADPEPDAEVERFLVGEAELSGELVNPDLLLRQLLVSVLSTLFCGETARSPSGSLSG
jgi:hypothetical protein